MCARLEGLTGPGASCPAMNDYLRIAIIAIVAVALARKVLPALPGIGPMAASWL